jgi:hypothetical protein
LLRAQIARITAATCISPDGFFELDDETDPPNIKPAEPDTVAEKFPKTAEELMSQVRGGLRWNWKQGGD